MASLPQVSGAPRLALADCHVELRIPAIDTAVAATDLDHLCGNLIESPQRSRTRAYLGETIFVIISVRAPSALASLDDAFPRLLAERLEEPRFHLLQSAARPVPLVSQLRPSTEPPAPVSQRGPGCTVTSSSGWIPDGGMGGYARGFAVLLDRAIGSGRLEATLRETSALLMMDAPSAIARNSHTRNSSSSSLSRSLSSTPRVAATSLHVEDALVVRCTTRGSSFVVVTATNKAPRHHTIAIDVPHVHVATTKLVRLKDAGARATEVTEERDDFHVNSGNALLNTFDFEERFHIDTVPDENDIEEGNEDEDSLFIPALRRVSNRYVRLAPGERFNFVYEVVPKGVFAPPNSFDPAHLDVDFSSAVPSKAGKLNDPADKQQKHTEILPRLANDLALESAVSISWRVEGAVPKGVVRVASAVRTVAARWNPHALAAGVVVALSGPRSVTPRAICDVHVTVRNQRSTPLERAVLCVRKNSNRPRPSLTPLRTAVALGRVAPGHVARVVLRCVALGTGTLELGDVLVVERAADGGEATVWAAPKPFEVLVADPIVEAGATKLVSAGTTAEAASKLVSAGSSAEAARLSEQMQILNI